MFFVNVDHILSVLSVGSVENCGGYIAAGKLGNSGYLCSPGFPTSYPNNTHCIWLVKTDADRAVHLAIHHLQTESSGTECTDFLEVNISAFTICIYICVVDTYYQIQSKIFHQLKLKTLCYKNNDFIVS